MAKHRESTSSRVERAARPDMATEKVATATADVAEGVREEVKLSLGKRTAILMATGHAKNGKVEQAIEKIRAAKVNLNDAPELKAVVLARAEEAFAQDNFYCVEWFRLAGIDPNPRLIARGQELFRNGSHWSGEHAYQAAGVEVPDEMWRAAIDHNVSRKWFSIHRIGECAAKMKNPLSPEEQIDIVMKALDTKRVDDALEICKHWKIEPPKDAFLDAAKKSLRGRKNVDQAIIGFEVAEYSFEKDEKRRQKVVEGSREMLASGKVKLSREEDRDMTQRMHKSHEREMGRRGLVVAGEIEEALDEAEKLMGENDMREALAVYKIVGARNERAKAGILQCGKVLLEAVKGRKPRHNLAHFWDINAARDAFILLGSEASTEAITDIIKLYVAVEQQELAAELAETHGIAVRGLKEETKAEVRLGKLKGDGDQKAILRETRDRLSSGSLSGASLAASYLDDIEPVRERLQGLADKTLQVLLAERIPEDEEEPHRERWDACCRRQKKVNTVLGAYKLLSIQLPHEQLAALAELQLRANRDDIAEEIYQALANSAAKVERATRTQE